MTARRTASGACIFTVDAATPTCARPTTELASPGPPDDWRDMSAAHEAAPVSSPLMTLDEAADYLRVSVRQVQRLRRFGELPSTRIGSRAVVRVADLDDFIAGLVAG